MSNYSLFKYMPSRVDFFHNFLLRASSRRVLNDPFEILPSVESLALFIYEKANDTRWGLTIEEIANTFREQKKHGKLQYGRIDIFDKTGVISFTETKKNILMWAHYADSHKGVVVEFDKYHPFFNQRSESNNYEGKIHRVRYDRDRPNNIKMWYEWFIYKSDEWIYEKEHRLLVDLYKADKVFKGAVKSNNEIEGKKIQKIYAKKYFPMFTVPEGALKSVTFGQRIDLTIRDKIINLILSNKKLSHVKLFQADTCPDRYDLIFNEIDN